MRVSDERLAELREKHLRDAARLSRHEVLAGPHRELAALLSELAELRAREAAMREEFGLKPPSHAFPRATGYESRTEAEAWRGIPGGLKGDHVVRRLVGPWEVVGGDA